MSQVFITASGEAYPCQAYALRADYLGAIDSNTEANEAQHSITMCCHERTTNECLGLLDVIPVPVFKRC